jgi:hypothetical protein
MSFLRKRGPKPAEVTQYTGLQIQSSSPAVPITIAYGLNKVAGNLLWYGNFQALPQYTKTGGKGGGRQTLSGYNYTTAFAMGLCEGPITSVGRVFKDQGQFFPAYLAIGIWTGTAVQGKSQVVSQYAGADADAYRGTATAESFIYFLGPTATIGNLEFEVYGRMQATAFVNGYDADPAEIIYDFLTNAQYGVGFPAGSIDAAALFEAEATATITISIASPGVVSWTAHGYADGKAVFFTTTGSLPTGLVAGAIYYVVNATTNAFEVAATIGGAPIDTSGSQSGTHTGHGAGGSFQAYCWSVGIGLSPVLSNREAANSTLKRWLQLTNSEAVWSDGKLKIVPYGDSPVAGALVNGARVGFAPNLVPLYDLTDDDFAGDNSEDPILVERRDEAEAFNFQSLQFSDRGLAYNSSTVYAWDQNAIERNGRRDGSTITANEICDRAIAQRVLQLLLQRGVYIRNTYAFKLGFEFCLLEPMDIVTLTDAALGLDKTPVRILSIEEDEDGTLAVVAEEFPASIGTVAAYPVQGSDAVVIDRAIVPSSVNPPVIFEPPALLTSGARQVWLAVSGGLAATRRLEEDGSTGEHKAAVTIDYPTGGTPAIGDPVTFQAYIKASERSAVRLSIHDGVTTRYASFDLAAGSYSTDAGATRGALTAIAGGSWYLATVACDMAAAADPVVSINLENPAGTISYAGNAGDGIFVWNPQFGVEGSTPSVIAVAMTPSGATYDADAEDPPLGAEGTADTYWGGCIVHISTDDATYGQIGQIDAPARHGTITGESGGVIGVDLVQSGATLEPASASDAESGTTLSLAGSELVAYSGAALTAPNTYDLSGLSRGLYGTTSATHVLGERFARLDDAIFKYTLPPAYVGRVLYLKFQSFNIFGQGLQDLATCATYTYTPSGAGAGSSILDLLSQEFDVSLPSITSAAVAEPMISITETPSETVRLQGL